MLNAEVVMEVRGDAVHEVHEEQLPEVVVHVHVDHGPKSQGLL